jgi:hypothetical protein
MGGRVVREEGGGVSMNIAVAPEFIAEADVFDGSVTGCPARTRVSITQNQQLKLALLK